MGVRRGTVAGGGDDEDQASWAVDTDEEEGSGGWEEVDLPERNEDIDPEVIQDAPLPACLPASSFLVLFFVVVLTVVVENSDLS